MNEEEKQAIHKLKSVINNDTGVISDDIQDDEIETILGLINKQQKEIEERLKEIDSLYKMMSAKDERIDNLMEMINSYNDMAYIRKIEELYISKDKIKEKMRGEINKSWRNTEQRKCQLYAYDILKELLGD